MRGRPMSPSSFCTMGVFLLLLLLQQVKGSSHSEVEEERKPDFSYWETWGGADPDGYMGLDENDGDDMVVFLEADEENSTVTYPSEAPANTTIPITTTVPTTTTTASTAITPTTTTTTASTATTPTTTTTASTATTPTTTTTASTTTTPTTTTTASITTTPPDEGPKCDTLPISQPECNVPSTKTAKITCNGPYGFITVNTSQTFYFEFQTGNSPHVVVRIPVEQPLGAGCNVRVNSSEGSPMDEEGKIYTILAKEGIYIKNNKDDSVCKLEYAQYEPCDVVVNVPVTSSTPGQLKAPRDPTGIFKYRPNVKCLWSFDMQAEGYGLDLFMDQVDLDGMKHMIDPKLPLDFLLVGKGADVLSGHEVMFFGELDRVVQVSVDRPTAHVFLSTSAAHLFTESQGFRINYTRTGMAVTSPPSTTPPQSTVPTVFSETRVPLNGMPIGLAWNHTNEVRVVLAKMSMLFAHDKQLQLDRNITEDDVVIVSINTCDRRFCVDDCSAYNFTVNAQNADGEWAFPREDLEEMVITRKWHDMWEDVLPECKICLDEITVTTRSAWYWYLVAGAVLVAVAALASLGVRHVTHLTWLERQEALRRMKDQEEAEDRRRKVSGGPSLLGGSIASRFSMPFPSLQRLREDEKYEGDGEDEDSGDEGVRGSQDGGPGGSYQLFDPDLGRVNINQFGLEQELLSGLHAVTGVGEQPTDYCYTNRAFVVDDDDVDGGGAGGDGSSTDSDSDVLHFSRNRIRPNSPRGPAKDQQSHHLSLTQATTAQVHAPDTNTDETSL